jgi:hypothetical protein
MTWLNQQFAQAKGQADRVAMSFGNNSTDDPNINNLSYGQYSAINDSWTTINTAADTAYKALDRVAGFIDTLRRNPNAPMPPSSDQPDVRPNVTVPPPTFTPPPAPARQPVAQQPVYMPSQSFNDGSSDAQDAIREAEQYMTSERHRYYVNRMAWDRLNDARRSYNRGSYNAAQRHASDALSSARSDVAYGRDYRRDPWWFSC